MTVKVGEAVYYSRTVMEYAPKCSAAVAYRQFAKELDSQLNQVMPIHLRKLVLPKTEERKAVRIV